MCQDCGLPIGIEQQVEFLRRYLSDQKAKLTGSPENPELAAEVAKTESLLALLENRAGDLQ